MVSMSYPAGSLGATLDHVPVVLGFGTSGRRGLLKDLTQLEVYLNALAEIEYLKTLSPEEGGVRAAEAFYFAADLRPSSTRLDETGRGELAQAVFQAIHDAGLEPIYLGQIPTPALTAFAIGRGKGSIMVTGSHIPFDRNGYKTNTSVGELLKHHEQPISAFVTAVRQRLYAAPYTSSLFDASGMFKAGSRSLPEPVLEARQEYLSRYLDFFGQNALLGLSVLVYQHSAVGRDLVPSILEALGAKVQTAGRSEVFVPIDTENIDADCLETIQRFLDEARREGHRFDAVVSTDGDSDRPLILGVSPEIGKARFFGGDLVGMVAADFLKPDAVVVPISTNDAIDRGSLVPALEPKTRIGSPFVIQGMLDALSKGRRKVVGWEANGGFLTGSELEMGGSTLAPLPTRDAVLPILAVLASSVAQGKNLEQLFSALPPRFSRAALLKNFSRAKSQGILKKLRPLSEGQVRIGFNEATASAPEFLGLVVVLASYFTPEQGFGRVLGIDYTDGVRMYFDGGDVAHLRPSGNADELRIYAVADSQERADHIAALGIREPNGILRSLERDFA
jgi:phosphomannomutase